MADIKGGKRILDIGWGLLELVDINGGSRGWQILRRVKGIHRY